MNCVNIRMHSATIKKKSRDVINVVISVGGGDCDFTPLAPRGGGSYATAVMIFMGELHIKVTGE